MIYSICFLLSFIMLIYLISAGRGIDINAVVLMVMVVVGNGGYYALYNSHNLEEAILANKLTYVMGIFAPMLMFIIVCNICRIWIKVWVQTIMYSIQVLIYLFVCTIGRNGLFYAAVEWHRNDQGGYLTKSYGPLHIAYVITMYGYMLASIVVVAYAMKKKRSVGNNDSTALLMIFLMTGAVYIVERLTNLRVELMPALYTIESSIAIGLMLKIHRYSAFGNYMILTDKMESRGYIVFNKNLCYMDSNEYATNIFPELNTWERGELIPGNGGRFNTFLRQPFMHLVNEDDYNTDRLSHSFEYKEYKYLVGISRMKNDKGKLTGYVIEIKHNA